MSTEPSIPLPRPGTLAVGPGPYLHRPGGLTAIFLTFLWVGALLVLTGLVLFGWNVLRVLAISSAVALLVESVLAATRSRAWPTSGLQALLMGVLLACMLPPDVTWYVPVTGAVIAVLVSHLLLGGVGNYFWHPAVVARVVVQVLFDQQVSPERYPVLSRSHLLWGELDQARELPALWSWHIRPVDPQVQAWLMPSTELNLNRGIVLDAGEPVGRELGHLVRDLMPPWPDLLLGLNGGAIGEACLLAVLAGGLVLMWRGLLRPGLPLAAMLAVGVLFAVLPLRIQGGGGETEYYWLPARVTWEGVPVGLMYVWYRLASGSLILTVFVLAADPTSSPLTARGHLLFGLLIGGFTAALAGWGGVAGAAYWGLLGANTAVPLIDRLTRRRILGT